MLSETVSGQLLILLLAGTLASVHAFDSVSLYDLNADGRVDMKDVAYVARHFGSHVPGDRADLNKDGVVDMRDIAMVCAHFLETGLNAGRAKVFVGWKSSPYGLQQEAEPAFWVSVARNMTWEIGNSIPSGIWVLGEAVGNRCSLTFNSSAAYSNIVFSKTDENEEYLDAFDAAGLKVWLQVEPAEASVETLIDIVLGRYSNHPCVAGFGVDVEWLESDRYSEGRPVTNQEAQNWVARLTSYNPNYTLLLKHWLVDRMPTVHLANIAFVDDSQGFTSLEALVNEFGQWGTRFSSSNVCFQIGYASDGGWWSELENPFRTIATKLLDEIPNCNGIYWTDETLRTVSW